MVDWYRAQVPADASPLRAMPRPPGELRTGVLAGATAYAIWGLFPLDFHRLGQVRPFEIACLRILTTCVLVWALLAACGEAGGARRRRPSAPAGPCRARRAHGHRELA